MKESQFFLAVDKINNKSSQYRINQSKLNPNLSLPNLLLNRSSIFIFRVLVAVNVETSRQWENYETVHALKVLGSSTKFTEKGPGRNIQLKLTAAVEAVLDPFSGLLTDIFWSRPNATRVAYCLPKDTRGFGRQSRQFRVD